MKWVEAGIARRIACVLTALSLAGCAATRVHDNGMALWTAGDSDNAIAALREAHRLEPTNGEFRIDLLNAQDRFARDLVRHGDDARRAGDADAAQQAYRHALSVDPASDRAAAGLVGLQTDERHRRTIEEGRRLLDEGQLDAAAARVRVVLEENADSRPAQLLSADLQQRRGKLDEARREQELSSSALRKPVTLQFRDASLRMVFEAISRSTGLNVLLDHEVRADLKTTIFVKDASVADAIDLILLQNQLERRTLNASTLFIYPATPAKEKEYQDLQVRTFRVTNADVKYLQTVLKSIVKIKEVSVDEHSGTIVIRDTPDANAVAAKVIAAHDVPDPEVMLEVAVLEVSTDRQSDLGVQLPDQITVSVPSTTTTDNSGGLGGLTGSTTTTTAGQTIGSLRALGLNGLVVSPVSASLNLKLQDTNANLLASPRIRARNKEKAKILIGDRVPTITNTVTPVQTGLPVITGSVQYQDVGLKLEFEPQVFDDRDVGIRLALEVSSIVQEFTDPQGGRSYQIGTRNVQTSLRLHDGETQVLGGLISDQERNTANKIPGLGHLPLVGRLFGNNNGQRTKSEIVLSITPHIIRGPAPADIGLTEVFSGTDALVRDKELRVDSVGTVRVLPDARSTSASPASDAPGGASPSAPAPRASSPQDQLPRAMLPQRLQGTLGTGAPAAGQGQVLVRLPAAAPASTPASSGER